MRDRLNAALQLYASYELMQEPKILLRVIEHVFLCMEETMEQLFRKKSISWSDDFAQNLLALKFMNLNPEYARVMQELYSFRKKERISPVEFVRKEKIVVCDDDYNCEELTTSKVKHYLEKAKLFIDDSTRILSS